MLILGIETGQRIQVTVAGREFWIMLTEVRGSKNVRLGFDAPLDVKIAREALLVREREIPTVFGTLPVGEFK